MYAGSMPALKHVPAIGVILAATVVPARLCEARSTNERIRCQIAPHAITTPHSGYDPVTDTTLAW